MDINELRQYPHKIVKIDITNNNQRNQSDYDTAMFKYTISDKSDNEIIVFSADDSLLDILPSKKSMNDYYISIPNIEGLSTIYAHYLMADLYDYEEDESDDDIFMSYDLSQLESALKTKIEYNMHTGDKPKIASIIDTKNHFQEEELKYEEKDPNYKHYSNGHFPIVSRYNTHGMKKLTAPYINQTPDAEWGVKETDTTPEWEARIPRSDLKIVKEDTDEILYPINVYLNYQYLPSSTEYHQHFFGFEDESETKCKNINVLDGDNLDIVNADFSTDGTYRLVNIHNKTDKTNKMYVPHNIESVIDINNPTIHDDSCSFEKNVCDKYYIYTPEQASNDNGLHIDLPLKKDTDYILKYHMWIPANIDTEKENINVKVRCPKAYESNSAVTWEIPEHFKKQDGSLPQQWIYHEIPFSTTQAHNQLYIQGPAYDSTKTSEENQEKVMFFSEFILEEIVPYSPTIKYTNKGVFVLEDKAKPINKPNKDHKYTAGNESCTLYPKNEGRGYTYKDLPTPHTHIYIDFDDEFDINYSERTGLLTYTPAGCHINYDEDSGLLTYEKNKGVSFTYYNEDSEGHDAGDLEVTYTIKKLFTKGINNSFTIKFYNEDEAPISEGQVECCIATTKDKDACVKNLGTKAVGNDGTVSYTQLNFSSLSLDIQYYLIIEYKHPCYDKPIIKARKIYLIAEKMHMSLFAKKDNDNRAPIENHEIILDSADNFPLQIDATITAEQVGNPITDGYCELSIDDEVAYTTLINKNTNTADFYLNYTNDKLKNGTNIKITFYRQKNYNNEGGYFEALAYDYFNIKISDTFNDKDPVPIRQRILINNEIQQNNNTIDLDDDDCLLIDLDVSDKNYINYSIRIYKGENNTNNYLPIDGEKTYINITSHSNNSIVVSEFLDEPINEDKNETYTVVTDNKLNDTFNPVNNKYRQYKKSFTVNWKHKGA